MGLIEKNLQRQNNVLRTALRKMELSLRPPQGRENEIYQAGTVQFQNNVRQFAVEALDKVEDIENEISSVDLLKERLLYKKITSWTPQQIVLEDGTVVELEELMSDCCASAGGEFKGVALDAVITDVYIENVDGWESGGGEYESTCDLIIYHNLNEVTKAELSADAGNGGFYGSVAGVRIAEETFALLSSVDGV